MKEASLRKFHRFLGVSISVFVMVQVITGLVLSFDRMSGTGFSGNVGLYLHLGDGFLGHGYRILLAFALLFLIGSGWWIFLKILLRKGIKLKQPSDQMKM